MVGDGLLREVLIHPGKLLLGNKGKIFPQSGRVAESCVVIGTKTWQILCASAVDSTCLPASSAAPEGAVTSSQVFRATSRRLGSAR